MRALRVLFVVTFWSLKPYKETAVIWNTGNAQWNAHDAKQKLTNPLENGTTETTTIMSNRTSVPIAAKRSWCIITIINSAILSRKWTKIRLDLDSRIFYPSQHQFFTSSEDNLYVFLIIARLCSSLSEMGSWSFTFIAVRSEVFAVQNRIFHKANSKSVR